MSPLEKYLIEVSVPYALRLGMYYGAFKLRAIACPPAGYFVVAGGFILAGLVSVIPFLHFLTAFGVPIWIVMKYTDAEPVPAVTISLVVELVAYVGMDYLVAPLIF